MSVVLGKTNTYGPGTIDIQIEQGATFTLPLALRKAGAAWNLTAATLEAFFADEWTPGGVKYPLTVTKSGTPTDGNITITFPAASSLALPLPFPPRKTVDPQIFKLGNWILNVTDSGVTYRVIDGIVYLDRAPYV